MEKKTDAAEVRLQGAFNHLAEEAAASVNGVTAARARAMYFDSDALREPAYEVYQLNTKGHRYYYTFDDNGEPLFYPSVTTILSESLPKNSFLISWIASKGEEEARRYMLERAAYGTFMHAQFEQLLINKAYDLDKLREYLLQYIDKEGLPSSFLNYEEDLKRDVLAFAQCVIDYDIRPYAVEIALIDKEDGYAGCIDCPCSMLSKQGGTERINAIIDFKSGRKGFFEEHEIQLGMYLKMWNLNYPNLPVSHLFNFSPKNWRKAPAYNLKNQTNSVNLNKIPAILELSRIEEAKRNKTVTLTCGRIVIAKGLQSNVVTMQIAELVSAKQADASEKGKKKPAEAAKDETCANVSPEQKEAVKSQKTWLFD